MASDPMRGAPLASLPDLKPTLASLDFVEDRDIYKRCKPYQVNGLLPSEQEDFRTNLIFETRENIPIYDIRPKLSVLDLETHGFEFVKVPEMEQINVSTPLGVEKYLHAIVGFLKSHLKAEQAVIYAFNQRDSSVTSAKRGRDQYASNYLKPEVAIPDVHTDATKEGGLRRIRKHLSAEEAETYFDGNWRLRILNLWRPTCKVVETEALAFCDPASTCYDDLLATDRPSQDYLGECYFVKYNPNQRFYWLKNQTSDEMSVFTSFDTHSKREICYVPHASFSDTTGANRHPRTSIEVRAIVVSPP